MSDYLTIAPDHFSWTQEIKKSRFILNMSRIDSEASAQDFVAEIRKAHPKATHHVFAYVLGDNNDIKRYSDNGEPSGTAGVPMLEVLQKNNLHDVVVVVTRYFGGIKLGAGGLIRAYAGTVATGTQMAGFVLRIKQQKVTVTIEYKNADTLNYWLVKHDYQIIATTYDTTVHVIIPVSTNQLTEFQNTIENLFAGQVTFDIGEEMYFEIPVK